MRALIFTSSSGNAHVAAGHAIAEGLRASGDQVSIIDLHSFLSPISRWLYQRGQFAYLNNASRPSRAIVRAVQNSRLIVQIGRKLWRIPGRDMHALFTGFMPDIVVATHPFGVLAVARYSQRRDLPVVELPINYEAHAMQVFRNVQAYCVAHQTVAEDLEKLGVGRKLIHVTGMPLGTPFDHLPTKAAARLALKLPLDVPVVLLTHGAMGSGLAIVPLVLGLLKKIPSQAQLLVITGQNRLTAQVLDNLDLPSRVRRVGFVDDFERYLRAADVLVGKAGGMSSASAFAAEVPLVIFGANAFESRSAQRFTLAKAAFDGRGSVARTTELVMQLLDNPALRNQTIQAARDFVTPAGPQNGRQNITKVVRELFRQQLVAHSVHSSNKLRQSRERFFKFAS